MTSQFYFYRSHFDLHFRDKGKENLDQNNYDKYKD